MPTTAVASFMVTAETPLPAGTGRLPNRAHRFQFVPGHRAAYRCRVPAGALPWRDRERESRYDRSKARLSVACASSSTWGIFVKRSVTTSSRRLLRAIALVAALAIVAAACGGDDDDDAD